MRRRFGRAPFRRRFKRRVSWLTNTDLYGQEAIESRTPYGDATEPVFVPLAPLSNDFVNTHPRFAKSNDTMQLRRILGQVRIGMYRSGIAQNSTDYLINYGICLIKGDYDGEGNWSLKDEPDPEDPSDEDDKWLFKNFVILSTGEQVDISYANDAVNDGTGPDGAPAWPYSVNSSTNPTEHSLRLQWPLRQVMMSTDAQLPNGSFIDLKTRRRIQFGEKLYLVVTVQGADDTEMSIFANWRLRVLVS